LSRLRRIGEIFIEDGLINEDKLAQGLEEQKRTSKRLGAALIDQGHISEQDFLKCLSKQYGIPFLLKNEYPVSRPEIEFHPSIKFLKNHKLLPIERSNGHLKVVIADPLDPYAIEALRASTGIEIRVLLGLEKEIMEALDSLYDNGGSVTMDKLVERMDGADSRAASENEDVEHLKDMAHEAPVINMVNLLLNKAVEKRASDIHIEPFDDQLNVRYRIDGMLYLVEAQIGRAHV